jgi:hypothetical protein
MQRRAGSAAKAATPLVADKTTGADESEVFGRRPWSHEPSTPFRPCCRGSWWQGTCKPAFENEAFSGHGSRVSSRALFLAPLLLAALSCSSSRNAGTTGNSEAGSEADVDAGPPQKPTPGAPPLLLEDCDPIVPTHCGYPYPSTVWTTPDPSMPTGRHVYFGKTTLPRNQGKTAITLTPFLGRDGFPPGSDIMAHLPGATVTGLPNPNTIALSVTKNSPTVLMEADTGALVPHFSELDVSTTNTAEQAFMIRPAIRLKDATRYLVAIRNVVDSTGKALEPSPVFKALRDDTPSNEISVAPRRALYADILSRLEKNGVETRQLQLAWDFTTASQSNTTDWMLHMRDAALAAVGDAGPTYTITTMTDHPDPLIRRRIQGMMTVPLYLNQSTPGLGVHLNLGANGMPEQNGTASFPFVVEIPNSLVNAGKAGPIIVNAHGLFGDESEGEGGYLDAICDREGYVSVAVDLIGMSSNDVATAEDVINGDLGDFEALVERLHQGMINELLAVRMLMGSFSTDPNVMFNGKSVIDPTTRFYRGDSQGGIFGGTFMALTTDITRGLLGEPGAPYNLLLNRSADFSGFLLFLRIDYPNGLDVQLAIDLMDLLWDRAAPDGYIQYIRQNMLPGTPAHDVLIHVAIGDHQVTPLGAHYIARTLGAKNLEAVNREIYGIANSPPGFSGSAMVEWNFGLPPAPITDIPMTLGTDPHDILRTFTDAQDMADHFFRTGVIIQTCPGGGPCSSMRSTSDGGIPDGGGPEDGGP